ncbi:MAG: primosomal protein N', partial [Candidatus Methylomirabilales bacterium]
LRKKEQVLLFLNRRGYATFVLCRECGFAFGCPRCTTSLTYHAQERRLLCHSCDFRRRPPSLCPRCGGFQLRYLGFGTQQVEEVVKRHFPQAKVARMDRDTTKGKEALKLILKALEEGRIDILVGTQMIGKGHDFPRITLVGVISADLSLHLPDFRAAERTFALLTQVTGRAGRGAVFGEALIQTYNPDHYCLQAAFSQDYEALYRKELPLRAERALPPTASLIRLLVTSPGEEEAKAAAEQLASLLQGPFHLDGPAPCLLYKARRRFRWQLLVKGEEGAIREAVLEALKRFAASSSVKVEADVDPVELL